MIIIITRPYDILQVKNFFKIIPRELKIDLKSVKIIENFFIKRKLKKVQFIPKIVQFILKIVQFVRKYVKQ
jgi:fumarate reductase subunit C